MAVTGSSNATIGGGGGGYGGMYVFNGGNSTTWSSGSTFTITTGTSGGFLPQPLPPETALAKLDARINETCAKARAALG